MEPELTDAERQFRDAFVREYQKDFDPMMATVRMGFSSMYAADYAKKLMYCPYVQRKLAEVDAGDDYTVNPEVHRRMVFKLLRKEATFHGAGSSHGARVTALAKMSGFLGMDAPIKTQTDLNVSGGVQFYIPHNGRDPLPEQPKAPEQAA